MKWLGIMALGLGLCLPLVTEAEASRVFLRYTCVSQGSLQANATIDFVSQKSRHSRLIRKRTRLSCRSGSVSKTVTVEDPIIRVIQQQVVVGNGKKKNCGKNHKGTISRPVRGGDQVCQVQGGNGATLFFFDVR